MEQNTLFDKFDLIEQTPTSLMTEITKPATSELEGMADHTKVQNNVPVDPIYPQQQPQQPRPLQSPMTTLSGNGQTLNVGSLITVDMVTEFINMAMPVAMVMLLKYTADKVVPARYFSMNRDEKIMLQPVLQNFLNSINFNVETPLNALLITVVFIYGTKTIDVLNNPGERPAPSPSPFPKQQQQKQPGTETRGRHKLDCQCQKCLSKKQ